MKLTKSEQKVMDYLMNKGWYAEPGFSDVDAKDIAKSIDEPVKSVRGVLSSLIKKNLIKVSEAEDGVPPLVYPRLRVDEIGWTDENAMLEYNDETDKYIIIGLQEEKPEKKESKSQPLKEVKLPSKRKFTVNITMKNGSTAAVSNQYAESEVDAITKTLQDPFYAKSSIISVVVIETTR